MYKERTISYFFSELLGLIVAIFIAVYQEDVWALILQRLFAAITLVIFYFSYTKYKPKFIFSKPSFKEQFAFGINLLGANFLKTISNNIHSNVIAKVFNVQLTGYFVQAVRVQELPINLFKRSIDLAVFPVLSKITDKQTFILNIKKLNSLLFAVLFPLIFLMAILAKPIVIVLLGEKWMETSWMLSLLMISSIPFAIQIIYRNILKSMGNTKEIFQNEIIKSILIIAFLGITFQFGIEMIIYGIIAAQSITATVIVYKTSKLMDTSFMKEILNILPYLIVSGSISLGFHFIVPLLDIHAVLVILFIALLYVLAVALFYYMFNLRYVFKVVASTFTKRHIKH